MAGSISMAQPHACWWDVRHTSVSKSASRHEKIASGSGGRAGLEDLDCLGGRLGAGSCPSAGDACSYIIIAVVVASC